MKFLTRLGWLPQLNPQVWILAFGRFLSQSGTGFTLFYAPIFFVNYVGIPSTKVGFGIGISAISGIFGQILGGSLSDSKFFGRRRTLLLSAAVSVIGSLILAATSNFSIFVIGNLVMGFGIGLYWPATEAVVTDLTIGEKRKEAYALTHLADNIGLGTGILLGGLLIGITGSYRILFVIDAISYVVFLGIIYSRITESSKTTESQPNLLKNWMIAFSDRTLLVYVLVNIIFTTYISQIHSTMPLYFKNFVQLGDSNQGFSEITISFLFTWHMTIAILCQLPMTRTLRRFSHPHSLMISALMWGIGFILIGFTGITSFYQLGWAILGTGVLAIAIVTYTPSAASLVGDIAPESLRGVYMAINSICWAGGYFIGPILGGWALAQSRQVVDNLWMGLALSVGIAITILYYLNRMLYRSHNL